MFVDDYFSKVFCFTMLPTVLATSLMADSSAIYKKSQFEYTLKLTYQMGILWVDLIVCVFEPGGACISRSIPLTSN